MILKYLNVLNSSLVRNSECIAADGLELFSNSSSLLGRFRQWANISCPKCSV